LKFGDVVTAVASLVVGYVLLYLVLLAVMIPVSSYWGPDVAMIVSVLVASLVVGYVFAAKIHEASRIKAIGRIAVLLSFVFVFLTSAMFGNPYANDAIQEGLKSMYATGGWTTWDWVAYSTLMMVMLLVLNVVLALVLSFIGLYAGSMLRKPKKT
jgi:hypothetical protein